MVCNNLFTFRNCYYKHTNVVYVYIGFFKILRGVNEVRIETWPFAGTPACMSRPGVAAPTSGAASFNKDSRLLMMSLVTMSLLAAKVTHCI